MSSIQKSLWLGEKQKQDISKRENFMELSYLLRHFSVASISLLNVSIKLRGRSTSLLD